VEGGAEEVTPSVSDAEQDGEWQCYSSADDRADRDARDQAIRSE
jgi:hypothetical protein